MGNTWIRNESEGRSSGQGRESSHALFLCMALLCAFFWCAVLPGGTVRAQEALIEDGSGQDGGAADADDEQAFKDLEASRSLDEKTAGPAADVSEVSVSAQEMIWYVRGITGMPENVTLFDGTQKSAVSEYGMLGEEGGPAPKTLILMDNSFSVAHAFPDGPDRINAILTRLIWNHQPGEQFAVKTFSDQTQTLLDFTDNYDELRLQLENVVYADQDTYLRNVLYEQIHELMSDGEDGYKRIVLVSDGTDDSRLGVTYEELTDLISNENYFLPIYTIASDYLPTEGELDKLFALSRRTDTPYFFLPEYENPTDIADGIVADGHKIAYFRIPISGHQRTGDFRSYTLSFSAGGEDYTLSHTLLMPSASREDLDMILEERAQREKEAEAAAETLAEQETEAEKAFREEWTALEDRVSALEENTAQEMTDEGIQSLEERIDRLEQSQSQETERLEEMLQSAGRLEEETETEGLSSGSGLMQEMLTQNSEYFFVRSIRSVIWAVIGIMLLILISYVIYGDRTRKNRKDFEEITVQKADRTIEADLTSSLKKAVILYDMAEPDVQYVIEIGQDQTIGRSRARSNIVFPMDRFMAGRQARIFFRGGKVYIENLDPDKTTKLNDKVMQGTAELTNGSKLTLGSTELKVQYE